MSIQAEINRINANIVNAYNAIEAKGGTIPIQANSANLASAIESISGGGGDINITNGQIQNLQTISGTIEANTFISVKTLPPDISPGGTATLANVCRCASGGSDVKIFHIKNNKYVIFNCGAPRGDYNNNAVSASILTLGENGSISNLQFTELQPPSTEYIRSASWIYQLDELTFANFSQIGVGASQAASKSIYYDIYKINSGLTEITMIKEAQTIPAPGGSAEYSRSRGGFYLNGENTSWILYNFSRSDLYLEAIKLSYNFSNNVFSKVKSKVFNDSSLPIKVSSYIYGSGLPHQVVALSPTNIYVILQRSEDINPNQFSVIDISYNGTKFIASRKGAISLGNTISQSTGTALFYYAVLGNAPYILCAMAISKTTQEIGAYNINTGSYTRLKTNEKCLNPDTKQTGYQTFIKSFDNQILFIHPNQSSISSSTPYGLVGTLITRNDSGTLTYGSTSKTIIQTRYNSLAENIITPTFLIENGIGKSLFYGFNDDLKYQYVPLDLASVNKIAPLTQSGVCNGLTKTICSATTAGQVWIPIIS